jgi:hypothetical protein
MFDILYKKGDVIKEAIDYSKEGNGVIICHCVNSIGVWGAGFVMALSKKWHRPEREYRDWFKKGDKSDFALGKVQCVWVDKNIVIANMVGQEGIGFKNGKPPIRYDAIDMCLEELERCVKLQKKQLNIDYSIFCPKFGSGLAGGTWDRIETLIIKNLCTQDVKVQVYEL